MPDGAISFPLLGDFFLNPAKYFTVFGLRIHWYGVIIATGFLIAVLYCARRAPEFGLTEDNVLDVILLGLPAAIICGRIYYVVFYWENYRGASFVDLIAVWNGGIAMYGVLFGGLLTLVVYSKVKRIPILPFVDDIGIGFIIGQFIGRWGNFINREAHGVETALPWRMGLTYGGVTTYYHPTFLYESLWNFVGFLLLHRLSKRRRYDGQVFTFYMAWYGFGRMLIEGLRTDSLYLFSTGIRVSQLVAGVSFLVGTAILLVQSRRPHDPMKLYVNSSAQAAADDIEGPKEP